MLHLSTVEEIFEFSGRNAIVVTPGIPRQSGYEWKVKVGDPVLLEAPDGTTHHTVIGSIEMPSPSHPDFVPIMLGPGITKQMVPIGTKIWISESTNL